MTSEIFSPLEGAVPVAPEYGDSFGYSLAMRVLQSPIYSQLDGVERAECDELIRRGMTAAAPSHPPASAVMGAQQSDSGSVHLTGAVPSETVPGATLDALQTAAYADGRQDEAEENFCPNCGGSGTVSVLSDGGPYAYEVPMDCPHCEGKGGLLDAFHGTRKLYEAEQARYLDACAVIWGNHKGDIPTAALRDIAEQLDPQRRDSAYMLGWARDRLRALADMAEVNAGKTIPAAQQPDSGSVHLVAGASSEAVPGVADAPMPTPRQPKECALIISELANECRIEDRNVGVFADHDTADLLDWLAKRLLASC